MGLAPLGLLPTPACAVAIATAQQPGRPGRLITLVCKGGSCSPTPRVLGAWSPVRGGVIPRAKRSAEGSRAQLRVAPRVPEPPRDAQMGVPTQACLQVLDTRIQAASCSLPLGSHHGWS